MRPKTHAATALATLATGASADGTATVTAFSDLASNPGSQDHVVAFEAATSDAATSDAWESSGDHSGATKTRDAFLGPVGGFEPLVSDIDWDVHSMHQDRNFIAVRSRATGTPVGPLVGADGAVRGFDIMTIDILDLEDRVIVRAYPVEDRAGALQQFAGR